MTSHNCAEGAVIASHYESVLETVSSDLYNRDLAPTRQDARTWSSYNIFTLWLNDVHNLGNYSFAIGLLALGMTARDLVISLGAGTVFLFVALSVSGYMGVKMGIPFPVMCRISFGIKGAQFPALLRGGVAIVWFGIQTYLASMVLEVVLITVWPSLTRFSEYIVLGLSELGWSSFLILWGIQIIIGRYGMESIRRYETFAGPIILANFVFLAGWVAYSAGGRFTWPSPSTSLIGGDWLHIAGAASLWVSVYGTFVLSFCDFTRNATSFGAVIRGNFWGLPINVMLFAAITLILTGGQLEINGILIQSPTDVVNGIPSTALLIAASIALIVLTIAVNLMANFVSASYALMNFFPQQLNFRTASVICAIGGLVILPWNLYNSPRIILVLLMGLGVVLGPLFGIIIADYWILRGRNVDVTALYSSSSTADFFYRKGYNPRAFGVAFIAMIVCTIIQVWPLFETWREFSWVIGAVMSAFLYVLVSPRMKGCLNRDGEAIAVAGDH